MLDKAKSETGATELREQAQFPVNFLEAQKRTARLFAETSELAAKASREIIEHQTELLKLETEQMLAVFTPQKTGEDSGATAVARLNQWQEQTDLMIAQARQLNDIVRDYGWQILKLYASGYHKGAHSLWETR
jgi:nucleosome binding factor SPN SPT16 subunit